MATRTRYILYTNGGKTITTGVRAIYDVVGEASKYRGLGFEYPLNWKETKTADKIKHMMKFVPPDWVLRLYREPKGTRKKKSSFRQSFAKPVAVYPDIAALEARLYHRYEANAR